MKIIVIGNGYDLNLGLETSFGDFYLSFFKDKQKEWDYKKIRNNLWTLLLYFKYVDYNSNGLIVYEKGSPKWMDVEEFISEVLNNKKLLSIINDFIKDQMTYSEPIGVVHGYSYETQMYEIRGLIQKKKRGVARGTTAHSILFDDLIEFEQMFMDYLKNLNKFGYDAKSSNLMGKLTNNFENTYVISFNYTKLPPALYDQNQVHGSLEQGCIIIGIDKSSITSDDLSNMRFTKSWRQLSGLRNTSKLPPKDEVTEIVVFGHSLGQQDYSYFHSLFNYFDIYTNSVKLTFLYADYHVIEKTKAPDYEKNEEHRINYIDSVYKLLNDYVNNSIGREEANSFLTKIQLEGRLMVEEINNYWGRYR